MPIFSKEDNKNLYESNLPEKLKYQIASFNELIMVFLKENFGNHDGYNNFISKIKEAYLTIQYELSDDIDSNACFSRNQDEDLKFCISNKALDMYSSEEGLIGIYFHEFFHFISYVFNASIGQRMEEGFADLFSDILVDFFNQNFAKENILKYKDSIYYESASIVRSTFIKCSPIEHIWNYLNDKKQLFKTYTEVFGENEATIIFNTEKYSNIIHFISELENNYIKEAYKNSKIENIPTMCIMRNSTLQEIIYKKTQEDNLDENQIKNKYPNIPNSFYERYKNAFSNIYKEKRKIIKNSKVNESELEQLCNNFINQIQKTILNPNEKKGIFNDYIVDITLYIGKYSNIFTFDVQTLFSFLHAYNLYYNKKQYSSKKLYESLKTCGYNQIFEEEFYKTIDEKSKKIYDLFINKSKEEVENILKAMLSIQIKNSVLIEYYSAQQEKKEITIDEHLEKMIEMIKKSKEESVFVPNVILDKYINVYIKEISKNEKLTLNSFKEAKNKLEQTFKELEVNDIIGLKERILLYWDINNISIYDVVEILAEYGIKNNISSITYEPIRIKGLTEIQQENDINNIFRYIKAIQQNSFNKENPFTYKPRGRGYDYADSISQIKTIIKEKLGEYSRNDNQYLLQKIKNNDLDLIYFYKYQSSDQINKQDEEILKRIFKIENVDGKKYSQVFDFNFDSEKYNQLKERPHLAAMYIVGFMPNKDQFSQRIDTLALSIAINDYKKYDEPAIKNEYKKTILRNVKGIINNEYKIEIHHYSFGLDHELNILENIEALNILDNTTLNALIAKIIEICDKKTDIIFTTNEEVFYKKDELLEETKYSIKKAIEKIENEQIKNELSIILTKIEKIKIEEKSSKK